MRTLDWDLVRNDIDAPLLVLSWIYSRTKTPDNSPLILAKIREVHDALSPRRNLYLLDYSMKPVKDRIAELMENLIREGYIVKGEIVVIDGIPSENQRKILRQYFGDYLTFEVTGLKAEVILGSGKGYLLGEDMFSLYDNTLEKKYAELISGVLNELSDLKAVYSGKQENTYGEFLFEGINDLKVSFSLDPHNKILVIGDNTKLDVTVFPSPSEVAHEILKYTL